MDVSIEEFGRRLHAVVDEVFPSIAPRSDGDRAHAAVDRLVKDLDPAAPQMAHPA